MSCRSAAIAIILNSSIEDFIDQALMSATKISVRYNEPLPLLHTQKSNYILPTVEDEKILLPIATISIG
jgi:hypothetical protein